MIISECVIDSEELIYMFKIGLSGLEACLNILQCVSCRCLNIIPFSIPKSL